MPASTRINPWLIVWLCFGTLAIVMSARQSVSIMTGEWVSALGWSKTFIGAGQSMALVVIAFVSPITGNIVDRYGPRAVMTTGLLLMTLGFGIFAIFPTAPIYIVAYGLVAGIGFGSTSYHLIAATVARLFDKNRGFALGTANAGSTAGQFITVPLLTIGLGYFSWRWNIAGIAVACALMAAVIWIVLGPMAKEMAETRAGSQPTEPLRDRLKFLLSSRTFHILFWSFFICGVTTTGAIETHFLPYAAFCGLPPVPASGIYGLTMAINFGGMLLAGWLADRVNRPLLLGTIYIMRALSFIVLMLAGSSYEMMILFAVIFGIFDYSTVPVTASLVASHLGVRIMGLAMGLISGGHALGGALGAFLGGYLFDLFARYTELWWFAFGTALLAGAMAFLLKENRIARGIAPAAT